MADLSQIIVNLFFVFMLIMCIFLGVHSSIQFKNYGYLISNNSRDKKTSKSKLICVIVLCVVVIYYMCFKLCDNVFSYQQNKNNEESYKESIVAINNALSLEFSMYKEGTYSTAEDIANSLYKQLPIKAIYYVGRGDDRREFSKYEVLKYRLKDFQNKPTLVGFDGMFLSFIKFGNKCQYVNTKKIEKSDCLIVVDVNHYEEPNLIGRDRELIAIDGKTNTIKFESNSFGF